MGSEAEWETALRSNLVEISGKGKKKRRRKRRKYSRGLLYHVGVLEHRGLRGLALAADDYRKRSRRSARRRRDGALRDLGKNMSRSQQELVTEVAKIPRDQARSRDFKRFTKQLRRTAAQFTF